MTPVWAWRAYAAACLKNVIVKKSTKHGCHSTQRPIGQEHLPHLNSQAHVDGHRLQAALFFSNNTNISP